ncbi:hypothetical protein AAMO2058_000068300 [Amorphochlora amoebiformis]
MGKKDLNPFVVVAKKKKKKKKKKKHRKKEESDSDSSLSSAVEDGALAKDETDVKIFEEMFMKRNTDKVVADASVYDRFSDNEESEEEEGPRLGPGLVKKISGVDLNTKKKGKEKKSSKKSSKKSKKKKKKEKEKKKKKKKKKKTASSDDDNPSDSDDAKESIPRIDLKAAFLAIDGLLSTAESMKEELSGMLGHIDSGEELEISGIPNPDIQKYLGVLFKAMLFKRGDEGGWQRSGNTPKLLPLFRPNIERFVFVKKKKKSERSGKREKPRVTAEHEQSDSKPTEVIKKGRVGKEMDKIIGKIEDEAVQKAKPKRQARAGPMMPSAAEMEEAKKLVDARGWENQPEDDPDDSDDLGPTLPGQNSEAKEQALEQLRRVREIAIERKKQEALKPKHEGWMTVMPEERRMDSSLDQRGRTFSMKGVQKRGDTSEWTMTPEERRRKQAEKLLEMHQPPAGSKRKRGTLRFKGQDEDEEKPKAYIPVLDKSGKSLLDMHQNERSKTKKRQIGGTRNFSLKSMREDRRFNKKEADGMKSMGKKLTMSFGAGQLYKSQM